MKKKVLGFLAVLSSIAAIVAVVLIIDDTIYIGKNQKEVAVSSDESSEASDSQDESNQRIAELEQQVDDLKDKQQEEEQQKLDKELVKYKAEVLDSLNGNQQILLDNIVMVISYGSTDPSVVETIKSGFNTIETLKETMLPPPKGGEEVYQKGMDALQAMVDVRDTLIFENGQCFTSKDTSHSVGIVAEKIKEVRDVAF